MRAQRDGTGDRSGVVTRAAVTVSFASPDDVRRGRDA